MTTKATCLKSIAHELNLSINTVSRALRDCSDISDATKDKVRQKAYEMGYIPNSISQFIKCDGRKLIALIINSFTNPYFQIVCGKLVKLIEDEQYDFTTIYSPAKKLTLNLLKQCISERVDGIITLLEPEDNVFGCARLNRLPIIMVGRHRNSDYCDEIYTNDELGGQLVANYLNNYHCINKYIYFKMANVECSKRRQESFRQTIAKLSPKKEVLILDSKQINLDLITLINNEYLGIFCFSDELAYEVLAYLNKCVPNVRKVYPHLHIVGYDCVSTRINGFIDITSIDFDYDGICQEALRLLEDRFENPDREKKSVVFPVFLHTRKII